MHALGAVNDSPLEYYWAYFTFSQYHFMEQCDRGGVRHVTEPGSMPTMDKEGILPRDEFFNDVSSSPCR